MILYLRCVWANTVTLCSYIVFLGSLGILIFTGKNDAQTLFCFVSCWSSVGVLLISSFGFETLRAYQVTLAKLEKRESELDPRLEKVLTGMYCTQVGKELAKKDFGKRLIVAPEEL